MKTPLEIDFRNLSPSAALSTVIRERAAKLESFCDRIIGCRVSIDAPHRRHQQGKRYEVHVRVTLPGREIVVSHQPLDGKTEDAYVAIHAAFDAAKRQLEDYVRQHRDARRQPLPEGAAD